MLKSDLIFDTIFGQKYAPKAVELLSALGLKPKAIKRSHRWRSAFKAKPSAARVVNHVQIMKI